jgi:hypothetical protein
LALTRHKDNNIEILDCSRNLTVGYRIVINGTYFIDSFDGSITNNDQVEPSQRYKISDKVILDRIR